MKLMRLLRSSLALCFLAGAIHLHAATYQFPELVRVVGADNKHIVGAVKSETGESLGVLDLKTGQTLTYAKASIRTLGRRLSDREAAQACGSARLLAWKIQQVLPQNQIVGKVASLDQGTIYTTLNAKMGISKDEALSVYRVSKEIRDPDTGQVLDRERRKIAKLVVTDVGERLVKAKTADDLEIEIRVGDEVEPVKQSRAVAILPATDLAGNVRASGKRFSEELVSSLTELGVAVVERSQLDRVRGELALQQGAAFDGDTARQLGKLVGAFAVLTGTISDDWVTTQNTMLRLVKVETGEVIFGAAFTTQGQATSTTVIGSPTSNAEVVLAQASAGMSPIFTFFTSGNAGQRTSALKITNKGATPTASHLGQAGKAYSFDGSSYIKVDYIGAFSSPEKTVTLWAKADPRSRGRFFPTVVNWRAAGNGYQVQIWDQKGKYHWGFGTRADPQEWGGIEAGAPVMNNQWQHIACVVGLQTVSLYIDGRHVQSKARTAITEPKEVPIILGAGGDFGGEGSLKHHFVGVLEDVRLYDRALSAAEVAKIYSQRP
ncbi:MAG: hypothetical protein RL514_856 [Verrucomicrobiota bacterium]|jgi:hypothetical protein